jgi:hypothetical protein
MSKYKFNRMTITNINLPTTEEGTQRRERRHLRCREEGEYTDSDAHQPIRMGPLRISTAGVRLRLPLVTYITTHTRI